MFEGIYCPSITITRDDGSIDYEGWGAHLDHLVEAGINGILIFGSIGEFFAVDLETKKAVVDFAVERVAGRADVLVGVGDTNLDNVLELTRHAEQAGASGVVAVSPYYFGPSDEAACAYFGAIAQASSLPVMLYNFPARTGTDLSPALVARLAAAYPTIVAIKDTVDTISHTRKVIAAVREVNPDFSVLSGFDEYYTPNRIAGGNGVLCGLTNVEPETFVAMHAAYEAGDYARANECARRINRLMAVYDQTDLFVSAIKSAVKAKGLAISTKIFEPAVQATEAQQTAITGLLA